MAWYMVGVGDGMGVGLEGRGGGYSRWVIVL